MKLEELRSEFSDIAHSEPKTPKNRVFVGVDLGFGADKSVFVYACQKCLVDGFGLRCAHKDVLMRTLKVGK
jgi:hypothetical protein